MASRRVLLKSVGAIGSSLWLAGCNTDEQVNQGDDDQSGKVTSPEKGGSGPFGGELYIRKVDSPPEGAETVVFEELEVGKYDQFMNTVETASEQGEGITGIKDSDTFYSIRDEFPEDDYYEGDGPGWYMYFENEIYQVRLIDVQAGE